MNTPTDKQDPRPDSCPFHATAQVAPSPSAGVTDSPQAAESRISRSSAWPPGPPVWLTGWGLLHHMGQDLFGSLRRWQAQYGDVVHLRIWPEHLVVLMEPGLVRELLVSQHPHLLRWERVVRIFGELMGHSVLTAEGDAWQRKRQALHPSFTPKAVQAFVPRIVEVTQRALARWPQHDAAWPLESAITTLTMEVIAQMMFSTDLGADLAPVEQAVHTLNDHAYRDIFWPRTAPSWLPWKWRKRSALRRLHALIDQHIAQRLRTAHQGKEADDLLGRLLRLHQQDPQTWPLQAVRDECMTAFIAGHETVATTLTWWAWCMASHPTVQEQARYEVQALLPAHAHTPPEVDASSLPYLTQTLQETLRLYPSIPVLFTRRNAQAISLGAGAQAWHFPARTMFMVPVQRLHHDARFFPEPEAFKPERFAPNASAPPRGAYLPFGAGPHVCLGQHLAMTEMQVITALMLQRFRFSVRPGQAAPQPMLRVSLRPKEPLLLEVRACT